MKKQTHVAFILDKNLNLIYSAILSKMETGKKRLFLSHKPKKITCWEVFKVRLMTSWKKMYQTLYG